VLIRFENIRYLLASSTLVYMTLAIYSAIK